MGCPGGSLAQHLDGSIPDPALKDVLVRVARTVPGVVEVTAERLDTEVRT
ncbi:hypothetical protein SSAG_00338 [Streptomyces sp. Mg1]|nr:hypothetical protein SSAG_00338 [Streptomyces sp. Mg1]